MFSRQLKNNSNKMKLFLVFYICFQCFALAKLSALSSRIIGGKPAVATQFPHIAAIHVTTPNGKYFCGGAIIGNRWIITAGQCAYQATLFDIQIGSNNLVGNDPNRVEVATSTYLLHPDFDPKTLDNDIALIELRMPIEFSDYIKRAFLPVHNIPANWKVLTAGWGQTSNDDSELSNELHWVAGVSLDNDECRMTFGNSVTDNMLCVGGNYNEGTCIGDTGSPLVYLIKYGNAIVEGIASFVSGRGCESTDPSGYTRVYMYNDWIINATGIPLP